MRQRPLSVPVTEHLSQVDNDNDWQWLTTIGLTLTDNDWQLLGWHWLTMIDNDWVDIDWAEQANQSAVKGRIVALQVKVLEISHRVLRSLHIRH